MLIRYTLVLLGTLVIKLLATFAELAIILFLSKLYLGGKSKSVNTEFVGSVFS